MDLIALTDGVPDTAYLARVGLERRPRYVLRPSRASYLVWNTPASTPIHIKPLDA